MFYGQHAVIIRSCMIKSKSTHRDCSLGQVYISAENPLIRRRCTSDDNPTFMAEPCYQPSCESTLAINTSKEKELKILLWVSNWHSDGIQSNTPVQHINEICLKKRPVNTFEQVAKAPCVTKNTSRLHLQLTAESNIEAYIIEVPALKEVISLCWDFLLGAV